MNMKTMTKEEALESVKKEHNHSWFEDIKMRNKNNLDSPAFLYRANKR